MLGLAALTAGVPAAADSRQHLKSCDHYSNISRVYVTLIEKSLECLKLSVYSEKLALIESDSFSDSQTLNFHLQALARRHGIQKSLLVIHDKDRNVVDLSLAHDENSFFVG
jgi:hypothetical protein